MKQTLKAAGGLLILAYIAIGILIVTINGCSEAEDPLVPTEMVKSGAEAEAFGAMKKAPDTAPAAPSAVPEGTPMVKSVGYYSDWKLTEKLEGTVPAGKTIFIKVVFSEPMVHKEADDNTARPILYYRVGKEQTRFKVAKHGASGEDFVSGDAKPLGGGTDDYIAKYIVPADVNEKFRVEIGKFNADLDGNHLPAFYTHTEQLRLGKTAVEKPTQPEDTVVETPADDTVKQLVEPTQPEPPTQPADTTPPTVLSITHYINGVAIDDGAEIPVSTVDTEVIFSEPVVPAISYKTGGKTKRFTTSEQIGGVHWRGICKPTDTSGTIWLCKQNAVAPSFTVTVTVETVDQAGNALAEAVTTPELTVIKPVVVKPQEPEEPTTPEEPTEPQPGDTGDLGYTFTFPSGDTYPGYNPSANLQRILDTHRSAKLPHFQEAVQMVEVIDWVYRKSWVLYPDDDEGWVNVTNRVNAHFGMSKFASRVLSNIYFRIFDSAFLPGHSRYWMKVEYLRLQLEHPDKEEDDLLNLFGRNKGNVVGIVNPND